MPKVTVSRKVRDPEQAFWFQSCASQCCTLLLPRPRKGSTEKAQGLKGRGGLCAYGERGWGGAVKKRWFYQTVGNLGTQ